MKAGNNNKDITSWSQIKDQVYGGRGTERRDTLEREAEVYKMNKLYTKVKIIELYKVEKGKILIGGLFFLSFMIHLFLTDFDFKRSFMTALVQCLASWILAFVFIQFKRKYYHSSLIPWWTGFYITLICLSVASLTILN